jgi:tetratricopeptide (TPR) repeat protein
LSIPINNILALHLYYAGRYDEAIAQRRKTLELNPNDANGHLQLSEIYAIKGMYDEALLNDWCRVLSPARTKKSWRSIGKYMLRQDGPLTCKRHYGTTTRNY